MFLSGPPAKSEACLGAGQARPPFEKPKPQKAWLGGVQARLPAGRLGLAA